MQKLALLQAPKSPLFHQLLLGHELTPFQSSPGRCRWTRSDLKHRATYGQPASLAALPRALLAEHHLHALCPWRLTESSCQRLCRCGDFCGRHEARQGRRLLYCSSCVLGQGWRRPGAKWTFRVSPSCLKTHWMEEAFPS